MSAVVSKYPNFKDQITELFGKKKSKWCQAYRQQSLTRGNNTNNYAEASMRILKDQVCVVLKSNWTVYIVLRRQCNFYFMEVVSPKLFFRTCRYKVYFPSFDSS